MEKKNLEAKKISAKEAHELAFTSASFEANIFKAIKHNAADNYCTLTWSIEGIDPDVLAKVRAKLVELGYEIKYRNAYDDQSPWVISW